MASFRGVSCDFAERSPARCVDPRIFLPKSTSPSGSLARREEGGRSPSEVLDRSRPIGYEPLAIDSTSRGLLGGQGGVVWLRRVGVPWSTEKKLVQLQIDEEFKRRLEELAKADYRSVAQECVWLMEQGIERREALFGRKDDRAKLLPSQATRKRQALFVKRKRSRRQNDFALEVSRKGHMKSPF